MSFDYAAYERECERIRKQNEVYLQMFEDDLKAQELSRRTISNHLSNADLLINVYNLREEARSIEKAMEFPDFFFDFYIRKCAWSTPNTVVRMAASLKKFFQSMADHGIVNREDCERYCKSLKTELPEWVRFCEKYKRNPSAFYRNL